MSIPARLLLALLTVGAPLIVACGSSEARQRRETLIAAIEEDIRGSDPRRERDGLADNVHLHVVEGLVGLGADLEVAPMLAERFDVSADGRTYTFVLREDVKFHNGATLTSEHVIWSWNYLMSPDSLWRCRPVFAGKDSTITVQSVAAPDARTIVYQLAQPSVSFLQTMARPDCAQTPVLHPASLHPDGSWDHPIGTGPFVMGKRRVGEYADLYRFAEYTARKEAPDGLVGRKRAEVERVRFLIVGDHSSRMMGLQSGDIDVAVIPAPLVEAARNNARIALVQAETTVWDLLLLNSGDALLDDVRIRRAISAAIDRDAVAKAVSYGQARGNPGPLPRSSRYHSQEEGAPANLQTARALLKEAGYAGQPINILANKRFTLMFDTAVVVQDMLRAAGVNATIEVVEWGLQLDRFVSGGYQAQSFAFSGRFSPVGAWERIIGPEPRKVWKDPRAIEILRRAESTTDPTILADSLHELQRMFERDVPAVALFLPSLNVAMNKRVRGIEPTPFEALRLWNVSIRHDAEVSL